MTLSSALPKRCGSEDRLDAVFHALGDRTRRALQVTKVAPSGELIIKLGNA